MNIFSIGLVKFKIKQDQFCVTFIFAQPAAEWDCSSIFSKSFSYKEMDLSDLFLLLVPVQYLHQVFCTLSLLSYVKYYLNSQNFRHFKTEKQKLWIEDLNRTSVL